MPKLTPVDFDPFAAPAAPAGVTLTPVDHDPFAADAPAPKGAVADFFSSIPRGLLHGLSSAAAASGRAEAPLSGVDPAEVPGAEQATDLVEKNVTGALPKPQGDAGRYGAAVGDVLGNPASWIGPGSVLAKAATGVGSAVGSEAAGDAFKGSPYEGIARLAGSIVGGSVPAAGARVVTPLPARDPEHLAAINALRDEGVTSMSAGQVTNRKSLRYAEDLLGNTPLAGGGPERLTHEQADQFTRAALRRVGEDAPRATPEVVDGAFRRIGGEFDRIGANNAVQPDRQFYTELANVRDAYENLVPESMRAPAVQNAIGDIVTATLQHRGQLPGDTYQSFRSRFARLARQTQDPELSEAMGSLAETMDDAMERSMARAGSPDLDALRQARRQYRNMLVIERAATAAGPDAAKGVITPAALASATKAQQGRRAFSRGIGEFEPLARAGQAALLPLPNSGTAQRNEIFHYLQLAGLIAGSAAGEHAGGMEGALGGAAASVAGPAIAGRVLMSRPVQGYLANQALPHVPGLFGTAPLQPLTVPGLLSGQGE